jgi:antitoxin component of MazEF toxin-antitoxin module
MCAVNEKLPNSDSIEIEIENDGTVTIRTAGISKEIHKTAEEFLHMTADLLDAEVETVQHKASHAHVHSHAKTTQHIH